MNNAKDKYYTRKMRKEHKLKILKKKIQITNLLKNHL